MRLTPQDRLFVLTGAGISAESGLATFRGSGGLWDGHLVEDVATPEPWQPDPAFVCGFYSARPRPAPPPVRGPRSTPPPASSTRPASTESAPSPLPRRSPPTPPRSTTSTWAQPPRHFPLSSISRPRRPPVVPMRT